MDALGLEAGLLGEAAQDEEHAGAGQSAALGVEEELRPVPAIEVGSAAREVAPQGVRGGAPQWDGSLLRALAGRPPEPLLEVDVSLPEPEGLANSEPRGAGELARGAVRARAGRRPGGSVGQP